MDAIHGAFPETPPYRGEHREVIPHLTIATANSDLELDQLEQQIRLGLDSHLPLLVEAQSVIVAQENLNGIWSTVAKLPLLLGQFETNLDTEVGTLTIARVHAADFDAVMAILREAADWLAAGGNPQWNHWYMDLGENILRQRLDHDEVYLFLLENVRVGTLTIQWSDPDVWGDRGDDGLAGYIHGMGISRTVGGKRVGESMLEWAVRRIANSGKRFARLDAQASNVSLCRYYEDRGFRPRGTKLLAGDFLTRLFEKEIILV
jgi:ribosomal protein S18 acetylase RimI-like enzyme